jgi:hypothetical protein
VNVAALFCCRHLACHFRPLQEQHLLKTLAAGLHQALLLLLLLAKLLGPSDPVLLLAQLRLPLLLLLLRLLA